MLANVSKRRNKRRASGGYTAAPASPATALALVDGDGPRVTQLRAAPKGYQEGRRTGTIASQPPIAGFFEIDRVWQLRQVLKSFEEGSSFESIAKLADAMMRDDRIYGTMTKRIGALTASPIEVKPANKKRQAHKISEFVGGSDEARGEWCRMFPKSEVADLLHWGKYIGVGIAEIMWDYSKFPGPSSFTIRVWHPQFYRWSHQLGIYQLRTNDGLLDLPSTEGAGYRSDGKWIIYTPYGFRAPWRRALIRPLAMSYLCRQWAHRDWARSSEKHGMPADVVGIPKNANPDDKIGVMNDVANRGSEGALFFPVGDKDEPQYSFEIKEPMGRSWETFQNWIAKLDTDIAITVLGQNLTTEVKSGSFAAASVHEGVEFQKLKEDAEVIECLVEQALTHWVEGNYGDVALTPRARAVVEEPDDELKDAQTLEAVGVGVSALQLAGFDVDTEAVAELWSVPINPPEAIDTEEPTPVGGDGSGKITLTPTALAAIVKVNEARAAAGFPPLTTEAGAADPDGELTVAEYQTKHATVIAAAVNVDGGDDGTKPKPDPNQPLPPQQNPPQTGGQNRKKQDEKALAQGLKLLGIALNAQVRMSTGTYGHGHGDGVVRMSGRPTPDTAGHKRTAKYVDAIKAAALRRAKQAMSVDLKAIVDEIKKSTSKDDLEQRLVRRFKGTDTTALRRVIERANIMVNLAGRMGALEEV